VTNTLNFVKVDKNTPEMDEWVKKTMDIINLYPDIFPHLYKQGFKIIKYIERGELIHQDGVIITFSKYKSHGRLSKRATTYKKKGDFILHQIATNHSNPGATTHVLNKFVDYCKSQHAENLFLTVRELNHRAVSFYERYGFVRDSAIHWSSKKDGTINGIVFRLKLVADKNIETICIKH
jgi:ribosomal protein S18 acetylase RimI-like enzyme